MFVDHRTDCCGGFAESLRTQMLSTGTASNLLLKIFLVVCVCIDTIQRTFRGLLKLGQLVITRELYKKCRRLSRILILHRRRNW